MLVNGGNGGVMGEREGVREGVREGGGGLRTRMIQPLLDRHSPGRQPSSV